MVNFVSKYKLASASDSDDSADTSLPLRPRRSRPVGILGRTTDRHFVYDETALRRIWDDDEVFNGDVFGMSHAAREFYQHHHHGSDLASASSEDIDGVVEEVGVTEEDGSVGWSRSSAE
jgi:hypothetical protein